MATFNESESLKNPAMIAHGVATDHFPLLSVVMPTRNRFQYAQYSIPSILDIRSDEIELVVQDSSDTHELGDWLAANVGDPRLRYYYTAPPVTMTENHNLSLAAARGTYVCLVGDDDSVLSGVMDVAEWAHVENLDAVSSTVPVSYYWPDFRHWSRGSSLGGLIYSKRFTGAVTAVDSREALAACCRRPGSGTGSLPRLYHGLVRRDCLASFPGASSQAFLAGASPDMYGAAMIAMECPRAVVLDWPITLPGSSGGSASGRSGMHTHVGTLTQEPQTMRYAAAHEWPVVVPGFFSVETVWAESLWEALEHAGRTDLMSVFGYQWLYGACLVQHPTFASTVLGGLAAASRQQGNLLTSDVVRVLGSVLVIAFSEASRISRSVAATAREDGLSLGGSDIGAAAKVVDHSLQGRFPSLCHVA